jgi:hypothetical protein
LLQGSESAQKNEVCDHMFLPRDHTRPGIAASASAFLRRIIGETACPDLPRT